MSSPGDLFAQAAAAETQEEADRIFELCVEASVRTGLSREQAERVVRESLGYYAGYLSHEARARIERLYRCEHPFFGAIAELGPPTTGETLMLGKLNVGAQRGERITLAELRKSALDLEPFIPEPDK